MDWNEVKTFMAKYVEAHQQEYFVMSKKIWENPELGMEEHYACKLHMEMLRSKGFTVEKNAAGMPTAFVATYGSGRPVIGFSAEYDALPGLSQKVVPYKDPVRLGAPGEGCGHNLIGTGGSLAAAALKAAMDRFGFSCTIKVFGTPAEELCIGKPVMGAAGLFEGLDAVLDWHPLMQTAAHASKCLAYFNVKYHYKGRTSHGNSPWFGRSALDGAILQGYGIEMLREHLVPGMPGLSFNTLNYTFSETGPEFPSVVPDRATLWVVGRFHSSEMVSEVIGRLDQIAEGAAMATETKVEKEYIAATHELLPNHTMAELVHRNLVEQGDVEFTEEEKEFVMKLQECEGQEPFWSEGIQPVREEDFGVTDSSEYSWFAPTEVLQVRLGPGPGWHNWMVAACAGGSHGEKAVTKAAQVLSASAADLIADPEILKKAREEWKERMTGRVYRSLLPEGTPIPLHVNEETMKRYRDK
ncbi:amidohydrolase [Bacilliculturomica massiliensis]|uniref:amidohydrolase n=1 Tax=Bacilliculturomica massiliensis TaxID=1917867 RepID=UPI0010309AE2|nr:amidohydrolase [Bacilliculturomica massiliensis]